MVKTKKRLVCPECGKELKNARSVAGHMWFAHGKRVGEKQGLHDKIEKLESEPRITPNLFERMDQIAEQEGEILDGVKTLLRKVEELLLGEEQTFAPGKANANPGNPGSPGDPNPEEVKSDEEEDDGLPDFFSKKKKSDDEKKSEKADDDNSWLL